MRRVGAPVTVTVRTTTRLLPPLPDSTSRGYRVDYIDGEPRITYNVEQVDMELLGALVHDLATAQPVQT